jgi:hypothetical protein
MQQNQKLTFFGKRNGLTFQKWTFLKCPISENRNTNLFNVFLWAKYYVGTQIYMKYIVCETYQSNMAM